MKRFTMFAMLLVVASLVMAACAPAATPTAAPAPTAKPEPTATPEPMVKDIVDTAVADGRFTTLVAAVRSRRIG